MVHAIIRELLKMQMLTLGLQPTWATCELESSTTECVELMLTLVLLPLGLDTRLKINHHHRHHKHPHHQSLFIKVLHSGQVTLADNNGHLSARFCVMRRERRASFWDLSMRVTVYNPLTASPYWRMAAVLTELRHDAVIGLPGT